jgi:K+-transporting ATPase ATPase C chain
MRLIMRNIVKELRPAFISFLSLTILCGVIYTGVVTGIAQLFFPDQANGSMLRITLADGTIKEYGSELLGQEFTDAKYLIGRPMGTTNLSPTSGEAKVKVQERIDFLKSLDPENTADIPSDLVTASGSGVDPNISPEAAKYQVARIARVRNISEAEVRSIIEKYTTGSLLGFWGEPAVNVLKVNLALDKIL